MRIKEILKVFLLSIITAITIRFIFIIFLWENMKIIQNNFHDNRIGLYDYQQMVTEYFYLEIFVLFVLPYFIAIVFYFLLKIHLKPKYNFLMFIFLFSLLFFISYFLIGYTYKLLK
jgi:hypothetical protein